MHLKKSSKYKKPSVSCKTGHGWLTEQIQEGIIIVILPTGLDEIKLLRKP